MQRMTTNDKTQEVIENNRQNCNKTIKEYFDKGQVNSSTYASLTETNESLGQLLKDIIADFKKTSSQSILDLVKRSPSFDSKMLQARELVEKVLNDDSTLRDIREVTFTIVDEHLKIALGLKETNIAPNLLYELKEMRCTKDDLQKYRLLMGILEEVKTEDWTKFLSDLATNISMAREQQRTGQPLSETEKLLLKIDSKFENSDETTSDFKNRVEAFLNAKTLIIQSTAALEGIFNWIRSNVRYRADPFGREYFQHPLVTLKWGGDCDCISILVVTMAKAIGFRTGLGYVPKNKPQHCFPETYLPRIIQSEKEEILTLPMLLPMDTLLSSDIEFSDLLHGATRLENSYKEMFGVGLDGAGFCEM